MTEIAHIVDELCFDEPRLRGAVPSTVVADYSRDLTQADMAAMDQPRGATFTHLKRIHSSHHALAKCLAAGLKNEQASLVTGYSATRVSQLKSDPAFSALVEDYRQEGRELMADMTERMKNVSLDALELLQERLVDKPEDFTTGMLLDVIKGMADRTGHGPQSEGRNFNMNLTLNNIIDRPPRETRDEWEKRRARELTIEHEGTSLGSPTGASDGSDNC